MKRSLLLMLVCLTLALAQSAQDVAEELRRTDQVIRDAKPLVEASRIQEAKQLLVTAVEQQSNAWQAYDRKMLRRAQDLTLRARRSAQLAARLAEVDPERIREEVRRTASFMDETGPLIRRANDPRANELWKMAQSEQATAEDALRRQRYGIAAKFTLAAREHVRSAAAVLKRWIDPERVARVLDRTDEVIRRMAELVRASGNQKAMDLFDKAVELQRQARAALRDRRLMLAVKLSLAGRELLLKAWEIAQGRLTGEVVERAIAETDELIGEWTGIIRQPGNNQAGELLDQAVAHLDAARVHLAAQRLKPALAEANTARKLVKRAIELVQPTEEIPTDEDR
jgi:hypothetical protein